MRLDNEEDTDSESNDLREHNNNYAEYCQGGLRDSYAFFLQLLIDAFCHTLQFPKTSTLVD